MFSNTLLWVKRHKTFKSFHENLFHKLLPTFSHAPRIQKRGGVNPVAMDDIMFHETVIGCSVSDLHSDCGRFVATSTKPQFWKCEMCFNVKQTGNKVYLHLNAEDHTQLIVSFLITRLQIQQLSTISWNNIKSFIIIGLWWDWLTNR